ncbi:MAG: DUF1801 domain-containing protein [Kaistella sp.]|nr:DUF1801 domain-containing protein [Kaistella sp.]
MNETEKYIAQFPENVQDILNEIRQIILEEAPEVTEKIAYGMPGFYLNKKPLVYFAAYKNHIGFYATPTGHEEFKRELSVYKQGKGSVQFPLKDEIPYQLIHKIVKFRKNKSQKS